MDWEQERLRQLLKNQSADAQYRIDNYLKPKLWDIELLEINELAMKIARRAGKGETPDVQ